MIPLRTAAASDVPFLARLNAFAQIWHAACYPEVFREDPPVAELEAFFRHALADDAVTVFLAGAPPCGYLLARLDDLEGTALAWSRRRLLIEHVVVDPAFRRQGHGRALVEAAKAFARRRACDEVILDCWSENHEAHAFFRAMGFAPQRVLFHAPLDPERDPPLDPALAR